VKCGKTKTIRKVGGLSKKHCFNKMFCYYGFCTELSVSGGVSLTGFLAIMAKSIRRERDAPM